MSISLQQLRSVTPGVQPASLAPGQICFNIADRVMYVGDGSNFKTSFDGSQVPGVPGAGWFSAPLTFNQLGEYYIVEPQYYGDIPVSGQVLTWDSVSGHAIWSDAGRVGGVAYYTTNAAVAAAPGLGANEKISNALGITAEEGDSVVVTGSPGDLYQGYYQFNVGNWIFSAQYAFPTATQVPLAPIAGLSASTVQAGIATSYTLAATANAAAINATNLANEGIADAAAAQATADGSILIAQNALQEADSAQQDATAAQSTANLALAAAQLAETKSDDAVQTADSAFALASGALQKSGGTMTGNIVFNNGQPVDAGTF
jgi:hypothetical protein